MQAHVRSGGKVIPLVQREEDEKFRSVFITSDAAINGLADLKGKDVSFGSQSSTSGHLMPRSFLLQAGVDPDKAFRRVAYSGAHDATIAAVAAGKVQAGALNISVWEKFVADKKVDTTKVRAIYTSRSGLTQMGHDIAKKVGMTMIGRATNRHFLLFTGAERFVA